MCKYTTFFVIFATLLFFPFFFLNSSEFSLPLHSYFITHHSSLMKLLHTADWHLGHQLYSYDRREEQEDMLRQIADIVSERQPDVFLVSGDIYHTAQPSATVQTLFAQTIVDLHRQCPNMVIIVTAGNHDSASRHEIFRTPWQVMNVFTIGTVDRDNLDAHIIEIPDKGFVIAVPYCHERNLPEGFFQKLLDRVGVRNTRQLPVILSAHTTVSGADFTGHDHATEYTVGGIDGISIETFGRGCDYIALGHIHHAQFVHGGEHRIRYAGTPLPITFDETFSHSVSWVEINRHGENPNVETIDINNLHPLVTIPAHEPTPWNEAIQKLNDFPDDNPAYIRLNVLVDGFLPSQAETEAIALCEHKQCRFCYIKVVRPAAAASQQTPSFTVTEFQSKAPIDIARRYADDKNLPFTDDMVALFHEAQRLVNDETHA